jgi:hypothetical protein
VIRRSGGVGVMLEDAQIGLVGMMVQAIEHVRRFTHRRRNDPRVGRPVRRQACPVVPDRRHRMPVCALTMAARAAT